VELVLLLQVKFRSIFILLRKKLIDVKKKKNVGWGEGGGKGAGGGGTKGGEVLRND